MGSDDFTGLIVGLLSMVATVAITFWNQIMDWSGKVLFPWLDQNFKEISHLVKDAFIWFDNNVAVPVRQIIKQAWRELREHLLKLAVQFERESTSEWVRRWSGYIIKKLESGKLAPVKFEAEEVVSWDELPPDVRQEWLKKGMPNQALNVTELRDKQVEMDMTY
ncbi:MAG: hypothetical protein AB7S77_00960 [Desulfatirhabdiaceae bacterium]